MELAIVFAVLVAFGLGVVIGRASKGDSSSSNPPSTGGGGAHFTNKV